MQITNPRLVVATGLMGILPLTTAVAATLEEIVVTAQKRTESVQDVPLTVTAISGEIESIDLNPVICNEKRCLAADARIILP